MFGCGWHPNINQLDLNLERMNFILLEGGLMSPDPGLFFWTVLIFVILWILLGKFAFKPITNALKERNEAITNSLQQADKAREEMAQLNAKHEQLLIEAKEERNNILKDAKDAGNKIVDDAKGKAKEEANKIMEETKAAMETAKKAALVEVKNQVGAMAIDIAEKVLEQELKEKKQQEALVAKLVEDANLGA